MAFLFDMQSLAEQAPAHAEATAAHKAKLQPEIAVAREI
jgi:hypothetical protein